MRYSPKELKTLAEHYGKSTRGVDYDGKTMIARKCPVCMVYEVVRYEPGRIYPVNVMPCKCDE